MNELQRSWKRIAVQVTSKKTPETAASSSYVVSFSSAHSNCNFRSLFHACVSLAVVAVYAQSNYLQRLLNSNSLQVMRQQSSVMECDEKFLGVPQGFIVIRVGGRVFETSIDTLCQFRESVLAAAVRFRGGEKTAISFDRDGDVFVEVLNYLRDGIVHVEDVVSLRKLRQEAEFFCLDGLKEICEHEISRIERERDLEARVLEAARDEALRRMDANWRNKCLELEKQLIELKSKVLKHEPALPTFFDAAEWGLAPWHCLANQQVENLDLDLALPVFRTDVEF